MTTSIKFFITSCFVILLSAACHKGDSNDPPVVTPPSADTTVSATDTPTVYIAGSTEYNSDDYAAYWVNGIVHRLPDLPYTAATGIAVSGSDIYVAVPGTSIADTLSYWKNGQRVLLQDTLGPGNAVQTIAVSGTDVYAAGTGHEYSFINLGAVYYKNNDKGVHLVPFNFTSPHESSCQSIALSGSDLYIAGDLDYNPVYWKNGTAVYLPIDAALNARYSIASSIVVHNGDTYVAGTLNLSSPYPEGYQCRAAYWKNGILTELTKDSGSVAHSIFVSGSDVYIAGQYYGADLDPHACYWKNGVLIPLEADYSTSNSIAVADGDVYLVGYVTHLGATYWKNGVAISLGRGNVTANAIVVVKK